MAVMGPVTTSFRTRFSWVKIAFVAAMVALMLWPARLSGERLYLLLWQKSNPTIRRYCLPLAEQVLTLGAGSQVFNRVNHLQSNAWDLKERAQFDEAIRLQKEAVRILTDYLGEGDRDSLYSLWYLEQMYEENGQLLECEATIRKCLGLSRRYLGNGHEDTRIYLTRLAYICRVRGKFSESEALYKEAIRIAQSQKDDLWIKIHKQNLAHLYEETKRFGEAETLYKEALQLEHKAGCSCLLMGAQPLAKLYLSQKRFDDANALCDEVLLEAGSPPDDPFHSSTGFVADLYKETGRYREAQELLEKTLRSEGIVIDSDPYQDLVISASPGAPSVVADSRTLQLAWMVKKLGDLYFNQNDLSHAEIAYKRAAHIVGTNKDPHSNKDEIRFLMFVGEFYSETGRPSYAEYFFRTAVNQAYYRIGPTHPDTIDMLKKCALFFEKERRFSDAVQFYGEILKAQRKVFSEDHLDIANTLEQIAQINQKNGSRREAESVLEEAFRIKSRVLEPDHPSLLGCKQLLDSVREAGP